MSNLPLEVLDLLLLLARGSLHGRGADGAGGRAFKKENSFPRFILERGKYSFEMLSPAFLRCGGTYAAVLPTTPEQISSSPKLVPIHNPKVSEGNFKMKNRNNDSSPAATPCSPSLFFRMSPASFCNDQYLNERSNR